MNRFLALCLTTILAINNLRICQATLYTHTNNVNGDHIPQTAPAPAPAPTPLPASATHYYKVDVNEAVANKEDNRPENNFKFHNTQKSGLNHHQNILNYETDDDMPPINNPSKLYTSVDYNVEHDNDVEDALHKEQQQRQYQHLEDSYDFTQQEKPSLLKQLQSQHQELSEGYAAFLQEPYQVVAPPKAASGTSNEHQRQQYLTTYVTPAPSLNSEMHLNLQHRQPQQKFINKPRIVSYATGGNEAVPTSTTTSIKSQNMPQYGIKYVTTNELNAYDNTNTNDFSIQPALVYGQPGGQSGSKQYVYAPIRSHMERKLPYSSKTLPYPPSFISFTTTEKPSHNYYSADHKSAYKRIPDLFAYRQSKSLLDSYIPSWQVAKMLQQYASPSQGIPKNSNLHTLAFFMPYRTYHK